MQPICIKMRQNLILKQKVVANRLGNFLTKQLGHAQKLYFFVQIFVTLVLISLCLVILGKLESNCEKSSVWISILSSLVGCNLPNPRL